jgi:hypothetical protein
MERKKRDPTTKPESRIRHLLLGDPPGEIFVILLANLLAYAYTITEDLQFSTERCQ